MNRRFYKPNYRFNTFIGGVSTSINTKALLASKLNLLEANILRFEMVGSDIKAYIDVNYNVFTSCFENDLSITAYLDLENKVSTVGRYAFRGCVNLRRIRFRGIVTLNSGCFESCPINLEYDIPNIQTTEINTLNGAQIPDYPFSEKFIGGSAGVFCNNLVIEEINLPYHVGSGGNEFSGNTNMKRLIIPSFASVGGTSINCFLNLTSCELISARKLKTFISYTSNGFFTNLKTGCIIEVHIFLATANGGNPAQQLVRAKTNRGAIVKFYDDIGNYVSTL